MSITINNRFAQHETGDSPDQTPYPVSLYRSPVTNVGNPSPNGQPMMEHVDVAEVAEGIRNGTWQKRVAQVRGLAAYADSQLTRTREAKTESVPRKLSPTTRPKSDCLFGSQPATSSLATDTPPNYRQSETSAHGKHYPECVWAEGLYPPIALSGLRFLEVDDLHDPIERAAERARIEGHPSVVSCWLSAGGNCLHITVLMAPKPASNAEAHVAFEHAAAALGLAAKGDAAVKNMARVEFVSHDPDAYLHLGATPLVWEMPDNEPESGDSAHSGQKRNAQDRRTGPKTDPPPKAEELGRAVLARKLGPRGNVLSLTMTPPTISCAAPSTR